MSSGNGTPPVADALQPNVLTFNPDGTIGADFTGTVHALGLIFAAVVQTFGLTHEVLGVLNQIVWQRPTDGLSIAEIVGVQLVPVGAGGSGNQLRLTCSNPTGIAAEFTQIALNTLHGSLPGSGSIDIKAGSVSLKLLDSNGHSGLLQVSGGSQQLAIDQGTATLAWAASTNSNNVVVPHGLGRTPLAVVASSNTAPAFGNIPVANIFSQTAAQFQMNAETKAALTGNLSMDWIAIG